MDIFNNTVCQKVEIEIPNSTEEEVANWVNTKRLNGELRYISNLDNNNRVTSTSKLIPTNR